MSGAGRFGRARLLLLVATATVGVLFVVPALVPRPPRTPAPIGPTGPTGPAAARPDAAPASTAIGAAAAPQTDPVEFRAGRGDHVVGLPRVVQRLIPYPQRRKDQMARYAAAHYGVATWRLRPRAVVLHFTESWSVPGVVAHFSRNTPNRGQLPGVCAHYLVDTDGTVYRLVPTSVMCRHTIGLNHVAIGIEVVQSSSGHSSAWADRQILARTAQVRSLLLLVTSLQDRYGIPARHVYGHGTADSSSLFVDRQGWRNTHTDWGGTAVAEFRRRLAELS